MSITYVLCLAIVAQAATKGSILLASEKLFQVSSSGKTYTCGNLPPWSPGRMLGSYFYPSKIEIRALKLQIKATKSASKKKSLNAKLLKLNAYLAAAKSKCSSGPPDTSSGNFDNAGNVTSSGKAAFGIPSNLNASVNSGIGAWNRNCNGCHNTRPASLSLRKYSEIYIRIQSSPMSFQIPSEVSEQDIADIVAYANY